MRKAVAVVLPVLVLLAVGAVAQQAEAPEQTLRTLLTEFLDAAGRGDKAVFERFFADDVIYTRATGVVVTKADIMKSLDEPRPADAPVYDAADVVVRVHDNVAVVSFRLVASVFRHHEDGRLVGSSVQITEYRNTGTFMLRDGRWQVVAWQATKLADQWLDRAREAEKK